MDKKTIVIFIGRMIVDSYQRLKDPFIQLQIHQQLLHRGEEVVESKEELGQYEDGDS